MKQYRDDLLASCLTMILSLPKEIITEEMMEVVPAIQVCIPQLYRCVYHTYTGMYPTDRKVTFLHFVCPVDSIVYCIYSYFSAAMIRLCNNVVM